MSDSTKRRVLTLAPMPPEKCAFALARYSRSPDSIRDSVEWVRTHDSSKFLESFYFQYGHASIADLGHVVLCFEGISELAATEIEDEQLWDGQARSSRYQDFSKSGFVIPPEFDAAQAAVYQQAAGELLAGYNEIHAKVFDHLTEKLPRPEAMSPQAYQRNVKARAFDVARYLLCFGIPTGVGQVTSIRTLERQVRRLKASEYGELRDLAREIAEACAAEPCLGWESNASGEAVAPTLARHLDPDEHLERSREDLRAWAVQNLGAHPASSAIDEVDLIKPSDTLADMVGHLALSRDGLALSRIIRSGICLERVAKKRSNRRRPAVQNQARRLTPKFSKRALCFRYRHGHWRLSRPSQAPALPTVPAKLLDQARLRGAGSDCGGRYGGTLHEFVITSE